MYVEDNRDSRGSQGRWREGGVGMRKQGVDLLILPEILWRDGDETTEDVS